MRVCFIGAGAVFLYHAQQWCRGALDSFPDAKFAVVEPDPARAADTHMEVMPDVEWAAQHCDVAIILTPSFIRWQVAAPFISRNKPVIIEKPLTISWTEATLFKMAEQVGHWICPVVNARCIPKIERMHKESTKPLEVRSWKTRRRPADYYFDWHGKFATDGGVLAQQGFHCLDLVCWFGGEPIAVWATGERRKHTTIECEDTADVRISFKGGAEGLVQCTTAAPQNGDAGLMVRTALGTDATTGPMFAGGTPGHTVLAKRAFAALAKGEGPPITVASCLPAVRCLHAAYLSMEQQGMPVLVGDAHPKLGVPVS